MDTRYVTLSFKDEEPLKKAIKTLRESDVQIEEVFTPFPVHGLDHLLGYRRSRLPKVAFWAGVIGAVIGFGFQAWVFTVGYPINFGGKPNMAAPSFIPVTFEFTILLAALAIVFAFLFRSRLGLGAKNKIRSPRVSDDTFLILLKSIKEDTNREEFDKILKELEVLDFEIEVIDENN